MTVRHPAALLALTLAAATIAACGGAPAAPTGVGTQAPTAPAGTPTGAAPASGATDQPTGAPTGGGDGIVVPGDQCSLASNEEVSTATGTTVGQAAEIPGGGCTWNSAAGGLIANVTVIRGDVAAQIWEGMKNPAAGGVAVTGIGDEALWNPNTTSLNVRKGDATINIGIALDLGDDARRRAAAEALGKVIVPRI